MSFPNLKPTEPVTREGVIRHALDCLGPVETREALAMTWSAVLRCWEASILLRTHAKEMWVNGQDVLNFLGALDRLLTIALPVEVAKLVEGRSVK